MLNRLPFAIATAITLLGVATPPAIAGAERNPTCTRELAVTETSLRKTLVHLQTVATAGQTEKCAAYRQHVEAMNKAREVFSRCMSGSARDADVRQIDGALESTNGMIARSCSEHSSAIDSKPAAQSTN